MPESNDERFRRQREERKQHSDDLRRKYLRPEVPDDIASYLFDEAYERGHASGWHEVEQEYDTLASLVNRVWSHAIRITNAQGGDR